MKGMNVIVVMADSFRKDHLGCYGNRWIKTPNIDKMASEGILFDYAYAEGLPTIPVRTSLFTGRYTLPFQGSQPLEKDDLLLAELLWNKGYISALISDTYHMHKPQRGFAHGFDYVEWIRGQEHDPYILDRDVESLLKKYSEKNWNIYYNSSEKPQIQRYLRDHRSSSLKEAFEIYLRNISDWRGEEDHFIAQVVKAGISWLNKKISEGRRKNLFLWLDCFDPHEPWDPPSPYDEMYAVPEYDGLPIILPPPGDASYLNLSELRHVRAQYAGEVTLVDKWVGVFIEEVEKLGLFENTLIIFLSDHGEPLGEHGIIRKARPWPYEELSHIPLIMRFPDNLGIHGRRIKSFAGTPDIMPTILDFLEVEKPKTMHGRSLLPLIFEGERSGGQDFGISGWYNVSWSIRDHDWSFFLWLAPPQLPSARRDNELYKANMDFLPLEPSKYEPEKDLPEKENLIEGEPEVANYLKSKLENFIERLRDQSSR